MHSVLSNPVAIELRLRLLRRGSCQELCAIPNSVSILNRGNTEKAASCRIGLALYRRNAAKLLKIEPQGGFREERVESVYNDLLRFTGSDRILVNLERWQVVGGDPIDRFAWPLL